MFVILLAVMLAFILSASAGLGGSLILIPVMALLLGSKTGIAISAVLLGCNNIMKAIVYRRTIPFKASLYVILFTMVGTGLGSVFMINTSKEVIDVAIIVCFLLSFLFEREKQISLQKFWSPLLAIGAGFSSGFTGTSGPLKGMALRNLNLDRFYFVGAASIVSMAGDIVKSTIFFHASLFDAYTWKILLFSLIIMPPAVYAGRFINKKIGEQAYGVLFWVVMTGYAVRLLII